MKNLKVLLPRLLLLLCSQCTEAQFATKVTEPISFNFTLQNNCKTSAGVYAADGTLIRTLWSGVQYAAGDHLADWDGTNDRGNLVPAGNYNIKVLSNNVAYTWDGVVGNSSAQKTGASVHRGFDDIQGIAVTNNFVYYAVGYSERNYSQYKTKINDVQTRIKINPGFITSQSTFHVCTDGTFVYWAGYDGWEDADDKQFIYANRTSDDTEVNFGQYGTSLKVDLNEHVYSGIAYTNQTNAKITGIAVQQSGNFLFVSRQGLNEIKVLNKTTGQQLQTISLTAPRKIAVDNQNNLWVIHGTSTVQKFSINANGTVAPGMTLTNLVNPLAIAVSPDNATVLVADGGSSQQVKAYDNASGNQSWTLGDAGGYSQNSTVTNSKFFFSENIPGDGGGSYLAFEPNGSFWVGDKMNFRAQHFSAARSFINNIMYIPHNRNVTVDPNDPTRVQGNFLEFEIDYSKPLAPDNNSWILKRNWAYDVTDFDRYTRLRQMITFPNGRTYGIIRRKDTGRGSPMELVEYVTNGLLRKSGIILGNFNEVQLAKDGSKMIWTNPTRIGSSNTLTKYKLVGYDNLNNPLWSTTGEVLMQTPPMTDQDPVPVYFPSYEPLLASDIVVSFKPEWIYGGGIGYHLGAMKKGDNKWLWRTSYSTTRDYNGPFPKDGSFDIGNGSNSNISHAITMDKSIFWNYHGEFWKNSQVNIYNHFYENGLFIGQFGKSGEAFTGASAGIDIDAPAEMAGNNFSTDIVKVNGKYYIYHCDESVHGGIHRWTVDNLNTINEQVVPVKVTLKKQGLKAVYFSTRDLNSTCKIAIKVDSVFERASQSANIQSVRWTGYIQPKFTESATLTLRTQDKVKLWIDNTLLINQWTNSTLNEFSTAGIELSASRFHSIRIEATGKIDLMWNSASLPREVVPGSNLFPEIDTDEGPGINLLEGIYEGSTISDDLYGWKRTPRDNQTSGGIWKISTGKKAVTKTRPDIFIEHNQQAGVHTLSRDLACVNTIDWKIIGKQNWEGANYITDSEFKGMGNGGTLFEVLDDKGKVILQMKIRSNPRVSPYMSYIQVNDKVIASGPEADIRSINWTTQPFEIAKVQNQLMFQYANYPKVIIPALFDATANAGFPKTVRFTFYSTGQGYDHNVSIPELRLVEDNFLVLAKSDDFIEAHAMSETVKVDWSFMNWKNINKYDIQRGNSSTTLETVKTMLVDKTMQKGNTLSWSDADPLPGTNYYRIIARDEFGNFAYSKVVSIKTADDKEQVSVTPNPIAEQFVSIRMNNVAKDVYKVVLRNAVGQVFAMQDLNHPGGSFTSNCYFNKPLPKGTYFLTVTGTNMNFVKSMLK